MKLYFVKGFDATYKEVLDFSKTINNNAIVAVNDLTKGFEFQNKAVAEAVMSKFGGTMDTIEFDIKDLMK